VPTPFDHLTNTTDITYDEYERLTTGAAYGLYRAPSQDDPGRRFRSLRAFSGIGPVSRDGCSRVHKAESVEYRASRLHLHSVARTGPNRSPRGQEPRKLLSPIFQSSYLSAIKSQNGLSATIVANPCFLQFHSIDREAKC
jgi:hypothetical protein